MTGLAWGPSGQRQNCPKPGQSWRSWANLTWIAWDSLAKMRARCRAQLEYLQGDTESAFCWADGYTAPVQGRSLLWLQNPHLAKAQILLARGSDADVRSALGILDVLLEIAERTFSVRSQIEVLVLRALALDRLGRPADGLAALQKAVELARPGGFVRVFVDLGSPMRTMFSALPGEALPLRLFAESWPRSPSRRSKARPASPKSALPTPVSSNPFHTANWRSWRSSANAGATRRSLRCWGVSLMTVKRHATNVYSELGVTAAGCRRQGRNPQDPSSSVS